jgi:hypothetical protein
MYLVNNTRPDISFEVKIPTRYSAAPTMRHWNEINIILQYIQGMIDLRLLFKNTRGPFAYSGIPMLAIYLIPIMADQKHDSCFLHGGTTIS